MLQNDFVLCYRLKEKNSLAYDSFRMLYVFNKILAILPLANVKEEKRPKYLDSNGGFVQKSVVEVDALRMGILEY